VDWASLGDDAVGELQLFADAFDPRNSPGIGSKRSIATV
jgi:hypothetical protein